MLKLIIRQANWGVLGSVFAYAVAFFVSAYIVRSVGVSEYGKYTIAFTFVTIADTFISLGIPSIIVRFFPSLLEKNPIKANLIIYKILKYAVLSSIVFMIVMYFISPVLDIYLYPEIPNFSNFLFFTSICAPIAIFRGTIFALYRSVLKIKEIMIYGTFIQIPLRAVLILVIFNYNSDIFYLVAIDIFTSCLIMLVMYYLFNKKEFKILKNKRLFNNLTIDNNVYNYGKKIYAHSIVSLGHTQALPFLIGILLIPEEMGIYVILIKISALAMFLNKNLRNVFSPAISKLYEDNKIFELDILYKQTTFIVNLLTIPFSILIMLFSCEILSLYGFSDKDILDYKPLLFTFIIARMFYLLAGNSGAFMIMAGVEKQELVIQSVRGVLIILFALIFIQKYELLAAVILFISSMIFVTLMQLIFIKKEINISPFSKDTFLLIAISVPLVFFVVNYEINFSFYHYILIPFVLYLFYFLVFYKSLKNIYLKIK